MKFTMLQLINTINNWLEQETALGSTNPHRIMLATASKMAIPSARIVAIREITEAGVLFFTQRDTRKVADLQENDQVSAVIWLPQQQRQIVLEGRAIAISHDENLHYWQTMPHDRQLRFSAYAPTSGNVIESVAVLDEKLNSLKHSHENQVVPTCEYYCGFRIIPSVICFYTLGTEHFSEVKRYTNMNEEWEEAIISP